MQELKSLMVAVVVKNLQNKSKNKNNKCFSWITAVRVISHAGNLSPPYLPRMLSNTVLVSGPAMGAAQILTWPYSVCYCSNVHSYQI